MIFPLSVAESYWYPVSPSNKAGEVFGPMAPLVSKNWGAPCDSRIAMVSTSGRKGIADGAYGVLLAGIRPFRRLSTRPRLP